MNLRKAMIVLGFADRIRRSLYSDSLLFQRLS